MPSAQIRTAILSVGRTCVNSVTSGSLSFKSEQPRFASGPSKSRGTRQNEKSWRKLSKLPVTTSMNSRSWLGGREIQKIRSHGLRVF